MPSITKLSLKTSFKHFYENIHARTYPLPTKNINHGNTNWHCPQGQKLWMKTLKKATFNEVFIYTATIMNTKYS